jgi:HSP20 family molecular chaperone IbpA
MADEMQVQEKQELQPTEKQELQSTEGVERTRTGRVYIPRADIYSTADDYIIIADMPGVDENSIDVTLDRDVLEINGFVEPPQQLENYNLAYAEYGIGDYQRRFNIPDEIDRDQIEATMKDGVLRIKLPKALEVKTKKIAVKAV